MFSYNWDLNKAYNSIGWSFVWLFVSRTMKTSGFSKEFLKYLQTLPILEAC